MDEKFAFDLIRQWADAGTADQASDLNQALRILEGKTKSGHVQYPQYGLWKVTTEGDCEGRSVRDLGIHEGYLDDVAFDLADKTYYYLQFTLVEPKKPIPSTKPSPKSVNIVLNIESGTWEMSGSERVKLISKILSGRPVQVSDGQYYASVTLTKK